MRLLALIFAIFFALLAVGLLLFYHKLQKRWNLGGYLALGYMIAASLIFWVSAIVGVEALRPVVCVVLAAAVLLWAVADTANKISAHTFRLRHAVWTLLYLALIALLLLRVFKLL